MVPGTSEAGKDGHQRLAQELLKKAEQGIEAERHPQQEKKKEKGGAWWKNTRFFIALPFFIIAFFFLGVAAIGGTVAFFRVSPAAGVGGWICPVAVAVFFYWIGESIRLGRIAGKGDIFAGEDEF